eukprot:9299690-Alexandrium_andersonii.AAC.1
MCIRDSFSLPLPLYPLGLRSRGVARHRIVSPGPAAHWRQPMARKHCISSPVACLVAPLLSWRYRVELGVLRRSPSMM